LRWPAKSLVVVNLLLELAGNKGDEEEKMKEREREGVFISREVMIGGLTFGCQKETNVSHSNAAHKGKLAFRPK